MYASPVEIRLVIDVSSLRRYLASPPHRQLLEKAMENFAELMHRLLEIQSGGRQRSPELIAEDERLMDGLQKRTLAGELAQTVKPSQDSSERARLKA